MTLDLFRDGLQNNPADNSASTPGVDASITIGAIATADGFDNLRIGGPSGVSSPQGAAFDNILLVQGIDADPHIGADFNHDGTVDGDDFLIWQSGFGSPGGHDDGDANFDGEVDGDDFLIWQAQFGGPPSGGGSVAVPEPASAALAALAVLGLAALRRRFA